MKFSYMSISARWTFGLLIMAFLTLLTERIIMAREGGGHGLHVPHSWADWTILPAVILMLASILLTHHNLAFFLDTMRRVRQAIRSGQFAKFRQEYTEQLSSGLG